jgi:hypothetical protein
MRNDIGSVHSEEASSLGCAQRDFPPGLRWCARRAQLHAFNRAEPVRPDPSTVSESLVRARRIVKPGQVFNRIHVDDIAQAAMAVNLFSIGCGTATWRLLRSPRDPKPDVASADFEECFPVCEDPQRHGFNEPPHLDFAFRFQDGSRVGVECKLFEPYGRLDHAPLRRPYLNLTDVWSDIPACRALAEQLATGPAGFHRLGASQLLKHILGLKFGAATAKVRLLYLYCDAIGDEAAEHREETSVPKR